MVHGFLFSAAYLVKDETWLTYLIKFPWFSQGIFLIRLACTLKLNMQIDIQD